MKIKVLVPFADKDKPYIMYTKNDILDFDEGRATNLINRKLAEAVPGEKNKGKKAKKEV